MISSARMKLSPYDPDKWMLQAPQALGASSASAALYQYILNAKFPKEARILELGSGSGVISIMLGLAYPEWSITGLEIQRELHSISVCNALELQLPISFIHADLRGYQAAEAYKVVFSNPPWQELGKGILSPDPLRATSRSEVSCTMDDLFACIRCNLQPEGHAILLYPPSRATEAIAKAINTGLKLLHLETKSPRWTILHFTKG